MTMNDLPGLTRLARPSFNNNLFVALFPSAEAIPRVSETAAGLRAEHALTSRLRPSHHWHITLHWLGGFSIVPGELLHKVEQACASATAASSPFVVTLDHALSFKGRPGNHPFVLGGSAEANPSLMAFHQRLLGELLKVGCLKTGRLGFQPHLTLCYDRKTMPCESIEPVTWKANEVVLVLSEVGATRYQRLGAWSFPVAM